jgi:HD-like signal output (HDOD) protein
MITYTSAESLVRDSEKIASPPKVFHRVHEAVNDRNSTTTDIARVISEDAGITMRLLRIVNSAYFGYAQKIETLDQAVTALGTQQVRDLVMATTVVETFEGLPSDLIDMESFLETQPRLRSRRTLTRRSPKRNERGSVLSRWDDARRGETRDDFKNAGAEPRDSRALLGFERSVGWRRT